ncbi:MAG: DUF1190 domain-containing protein [Pseudomonadota bacterium]
MALHHSLRMPPLAAALLTLSLAACGNAAAPKEEAAKAIYTGSADCAEGGKLSYEQCAEAMSAAVSEHEKSAPHYPSLKRCEEKEGSGKCENTETGQYRPKLLAFFVVASQPPVATPLYPASKGEPGFRGADNRLYLEKDHTITFSEHAQTLFEVHLDKRFKKKL